MHNEAPRPGSVSVTAADEPLTTAVIDNYAEVVLGAHEDGTPIVQVSLGYVHGSTAISVVHEFTDAGLLEDLAAALAAAADHVRNSTDG